MSGYSYTEIQNMQQKAMERVREMKRNSDIVTQTAQRDLDFMDDNRNYDNILQKATPKVTNMPPNFPENNPYSSIKDFAMDVSRKEQPGQSKIKEEIPIKQGLDKLFDEPDKALILGLIMLLKSEGADESLIMALTYILS